MSEPRRPWPVPPSRGPMQQTAAWEPHDPKSAQHLITDRREAEQYVVDAIEGSSAGEDSAADFDVAAIASDLIDRCQPLRQYYGSTLAWDFGEIPPDDFWALVERYYIAL